MRILYLANGIPVPGSLGGSTHTLEVARGLALRGHSVHVVACEQETRFLPADLLRPRSQSFDGFQLHWLDIPKAAALATLPVIGRLVRAIRPDAIMERYYNFAGAGIIAAHRAGIPSLLEVNALIVDPPMVRKRQIDDRLGEPMRRWAEWQCQHADRIVTPLHTTIPAAIPRSKIVELPWGAAVERFEPVASQRQPCNGRPTVLFLGSFRAWHGVTDVIRACGALLNAGHDLKVVLVGDGPQRAEAEALAAAWPGHFDFVGAVPYQQVPALLAEATIGVAPFNTAPHPALRAAGFFWSPLKVYEYMAAGLPVVTADIAPLNHVIRNGQEGVLFREGDPADLARAIVEVLADRQQAFLMGQRGRVRVSEHYSWAQHCAELERILEEIRQQKRASNAHPAA
ncbi:MAG: glycosyltransferase family 4 protein [Roseiflexaceae bacterium]